MLASHSNDRSQRAVPRNLSESLLTALARKGGLVGVMFHGPFLRAGARPNRTDVAAHVKALVDRRLGQIVLFAQGDGPRDLRGVVVAHAQSLYQAFAHEVMTDLQ